MANIEQFDTFQFISAKLLLLNLSYQLYINIVTKENKNKLSLI
jgi:hypothetical protein